MANEITVQTNLAVTKGNLFDVSRGSISPLAASVSINMAGTNAILDTQTFTTSETAIAKGAVGTIGMVHLKNLDPTNDFFWRSGTGATNTVQVKPGEVACFRSATSTPYGIASAGSVQVEILLVEA